MEPITEAPTTTKRGLIDRLAVGLLIGAVGISVGAIALLTVYVNRIGYAAEAMQRVEPLPSYAGRPAPVSSNGAGAVNYLLMTTAKDGSLESVLIAHLSASRRHLTLIALPADLLGYDGTGQMTLAESYARDSLWMARSVEQLTGSRMDHQVHLDLVRFAGVIDTLGGLDLGNGRLTGPEVVGSLDNVPDPLNRSVQTANLLKAALAHSTMSLAITNPDKFDQLMNALTPSVTVDAGLTADEIKNTMVESRVRADEVAIWPLAVSAGRGGSHAEPMGLAQLRNDLAADHLAAGGSLTNSAVQPSPEPTR